MESRVPHMLHLFNMFRENKDSDNCAQLLEEEERALNAQNREGA